MMDRSESFSIGVDVGATKIALALVTESGAVLDSCAFPTEAGRGADWVVKKIAAGINDFILRSNGAPQGIGIGIPGQVNTPLGIVRNAINLGWSEIPLREKIQPLLARDIPLWIQKDTNASALGEYIFGAARGCQDFVYLSVGSGLGGGVLASGRLITGANWGAAELGHHSLDPHGQRCSCGLRGCAETLVSGPGLLNLARAYLDERGYATSLDGSVELTTAGILAAAERGDPLALVALAEVGKGLGIVMAACQSVLDPAMYVIGGGLGLAGYAYMVPAAKIELQHRIIPAGGPEVVCSPSRVSSSAVGAASLVWYYGGVAGGNAGNAEGSNR